MFRRRSERLTSATAAHGGQGVRQVDPRVSRSMASRPARTSGRAPTTRQMIASGRPTAAGCQYGTFTGPHRDEVLPQWLRYPRLMSGARKQAVRPAVQHSAHGPSRCCPSGFGTLAQRRRRRLATLQARRDPRSPTTASAEQATHSTQDESPGGTVGRLGRRHGLHVPGRDKHYFHDPFRISGLRPSKTGKRGHARPAGPKDIQNRSLTSAARANDASQKVDGR